MLNIIPVALTVVLTVDVRTVTPLSAWTCPGLAVTLCLLKGGLGWGLWALLAPVFPVTWLRTRVVPWMVCPLGFGSSIGQDS